jgi:hypothetical protein
MIYQPPLKEVASAVYYYVYILSRQSYFGLALRSRMESARGKLIAMSDELPFLFLFAFTCVVPQWRAQGSMPAVRIHDTRWPHPRDVRLCCVVRDPSPPLGCL